MTRGDSKNNGEGARSDPTVTAKEQRANLTFASELTRRAHQPIQKEEVWHYTHGQALCEILRSGDLWSTQISCLNDRSEQKYFSDLILEKSRARLSKSSDNNLKQMWSYIESELSNAEFVAFSRFVTCFSGKRDDLSQWRGYGGGECGYAIGFDPQSLTNYAKNSGGQIYFLNINYDTSFHNQCITEISDYIEEEYIKGLRKRGGHPDWMKNFLSDFALFSSLLPSMFKDEAFEAEKELRLVSTLPPERVKHLIFRQRRTLLARHLPLPIRDTLGDKLPITKIIIGPGGDQRVTLVSVNDMLSAYEYKNVAVELSKIPYRAP